MEQSNRRRSLVCPSMLLGIGVPITAYAQPRTLDVWPPAQHPNVSVVPECYNALRPVQHVIDASYGQNFGVLIRADYLPNQSPTPDPALYGRFQGWGSNFYGQLACADTPAPGCFASGQPTGLCMAAPPGVASGDIRLRRVSASWDHVLALTDDPAFANTRGLIAWGNNEHGTCNIPDFNAHPYFIDGIGNPPTAKVVDLAAGEFINIVLFDNGKVAAWGHRDWGIGPGPQQAQQVWYEEYTHIYARQNDAVNPWRFTAIAAGGHFVAALGFVGRIDMHKSPPEPIEGEVITWGTFDYNVNQHFGPNYRKGDSRQPPRPPPPAPLLDPWEPWSNKECGLGTQVPQVYAPPYKAIGACHQSCWGIVADGSTVHGWGNQAADALVIPSAESYSQVTGGYHQWGYGVMLNVVNGDRAYRLVGWGGNSPTVTCPVLGGFPLPTGAPTAEVGTYYKLAPGNSNYSVQIGMCHTANCDGSTGSPLLTANDLACFNTRFLTAQSLPNDQQIIDFANCDGSTGNPALTANDFQCFLNLWLKQVETGGCP